MGQTHHRIDRSKYKGVAGAEVLNLQLIMMNALATVQACNSEM